MRMLQACFLGIIFLFSQLDAYQHQISVTAIFRNEGRFLQEWIEYYKLQGVEHFYLYNNRSEDNYAEVLAPYVTAGLVDLIEWNYKPRSWKDWDNIQKDAYHHAMKLAKKKSKWLAIIDIDEFIVPIGAAQNETKALQSFLKAYESDNTVGALCIPWVFFGTSHLTHIPSDKLLIESLTLNGGAACGGDASAIWATGSYKSIVQPKYVKEVSSPHYCQLSHGRKSILVYFDKAQLNHYWTKDEDFLYNIKIDRRSSWGQNPEEILMWASGMNAETPYGNPILRFVPALKQNIFDD